MRTALLSFLVLAGCSAVAPPSHFGPEQAVSGSVILTEHGYFSIQKRVMIFFATFISRRGYLHATRTHLLAKQVKNRASALSEDEPCPGRQNYRESRTAGTKWLA